MQYGADYSPNYLVSIIGVEIPKKIAQVARKMRLEQDTPMEERKRCIHCGQWLPMDTLFFSRNNAHKDRLSNVCKPCDRASRIRRGIISGNRDHRKKDPTLPEV